MNILRLLFELFVIYILYKFIFDFIIPVYKTTRQVKQKMDDMQQRMRQTQGTQAPDPYEIRPGQQTPTAAKRPASDDYIEYEEVK